MTKRELIKALEKMCEDKVVVFTDGIGWSNIETVTEKVSTIEMLTERDPLFSD